MADSVGALSAPYTVKGIPEDDVPAGDGPYAFRVYTGTGGATTRPSLYDAFRFKGFLEAMPDAVVICEAGGGIDFV